MLQIEHMRMQLRLPKSMKLKKFIKNIQDLFEDDDVDIVYISTPHNTHIQYLREALKHGKHVLCEKSITLNAKELEEAKQLAEENGVVLAEAMTIYHMPLYKKLQEVIRSGKLGKLCMAQMNFGSYKEYDMQNRFFNPNLAGGACWTSAYMPFRLFGHLCPVHRIRLYHR